MSGSVLSGRHHSRPDIYAGSRRRISGLGTIGGGAVTTLTDLGRRLQEDPKAPGPTPAS